MCLSIMEGHKNPIQHIDFSNDGCYKIISRIIIDILCKREFYHNMGFECILNSKSSYRSLIMG